MLTTPPSFTLRHSLRPGDVDAIVRMHGFIYTREFGFDATFEAYVAGPLAEFVRQPGERSRLWIAETDHRLLGSIAIVEATEREAQLRWFLLDPSARGLGLGKHLLTEAVAFAHQTEYESIFLWTVSTLTTAARLYRTAGFARVEEKPARLWGVDLIEERYVLDLKALAT